MLRAEQSRIWFSAEAWIPIFATMSTGSGAYPDSYSMGTDDSFPVYKAPGPVDIATLGMRGTILPHHHTSSFLGYQLSTKALSRDNFRGSFGRRWTYDSTVTWRG